MQNSNQLNLVEHPIFWVSLKEIQNACGKGVEFLVRIYKNEGFYPLAEYLGMSVPEAIQKLSDIQNSLELHRKNFQVRAQKKKDALILIENKRRIQVAQQVKKFNATVNALIPLDDKAILLREPTEMCHETETALKIVKDVMFCTNCEPVDVLELPNNSQLFSNNERVWAFLAHKCYEQCKKVKMFPEFILFWEQHFSDIKIRLFVDVSRRNQRLAKTIVKRIETLTTELLPTGKKKGVVDCSDIKRIVANHFGLEVKHLECGKRYRNFVTARQFAYILSSERTTQHMSLKQIGRKFGDRDHTTILHGIRRIKSKVEASTEFADQLNVLEEKIKALNGAHKIGTMAEEVTELADQPKELGEKIAA